MKMTLPRYEGTSCQNCGHSSHCGNPLYLEVRDYGVDAEPYQIKACSSCRCKLCEEKSKNLFKKKS
jgi:hypothetical protein